MKKSLTDNQQKIIDSLVAEFIKENEASKKVNTKNAIQFIEDKINFTKQQEEECKKFNTLEGKKVEAFLEDLINKLSPILKKYKIGITRCYSGCGLVKRSVYLKMEVFWKGYGMPLTQTLCVEPAICRENVGLFIKEKWASIRVGYPTYKDNYVEGKDQAKVIEHIAEWIADCKEKEVRDLASVA